jgi:exosortase A
MAREKALTKADLGCDEADGVPPGIDTIALTPVPIDGSDRRPSGLSTGVPASFATDWKIAGAAVLLAITGILYWYRETAASIVDIWNRSETFNHCYLVLPISLYLIWRRRSALAALSPRPAFAALVLVAGAGMLWLLGASANVLGPTQWALVLMIQLSVWTLLGTKATRAMAFPLLFLFFAIPFGEIFVPYMMDWTADMTVWALRLSGIPVFREGEHFSIPSGHWSVVEACSGLRYLIASVMVGSLYAYLTYRSAARRWAFVAASIVVPVAANWLRAYMIVMLGHLSGNRVAVGVDHIIYGWVFFGLVITLMFWIGARWREDERLPSESLTVPVKAVNATGREGHRGMVFTIALVAVLAVTAVWKPVGDFLESRIVTSAPELGELAAAPGWSSREGQLTDWQPAFRGARAELTRTFSRDGKDVGLFVEYYRNQSLNGKLISSANRLIGDKSPWIVTSGGEVRTEIEGSPVAVRFDELRGPDGRLLVWRWYWIDGRWTANDYLGSAYLALAHLFGRGDDAAVVLLYTPAPDGRRKAEQVLGEFLAAHSAELGRMFDEARHR